MKSSTQWLTQQRLKSSLVVMNYSTTAAGGAKKAILEGTVSQLFCGLPPSLQSQYHIYSVPGFWQFQLTLPFKLHCSSIWFFSFQNRWLGDYKLKALRTGIRTLTTEQREPQTPFSHLSQDQEVNVGLIHSWQTLGTHLGLSLDLESYFTSGSQKIISLPELFMPRCLSHSAVISGLRGKVKTSISQRDFFSGPWGFWKGCNDSSKACTDSWFVVPSQVGYISFEPSQMFL